MERLKPKIYEMAKDQGFQTADDMITGVIKEARNAEEMSAGIVMLRYAALSILGHVAYNGKSKGVPVGKAVANFVLDIVRIEEIISKSPVTQDFEPGGKVREDNGN